MELICYWEKFNEKVRCLNFSARHTFNFTIQQELDLAVKLEMVYTENTNFPLDFWGDKCISLAAIVGENGSGKTTIMKRVYEKASTLPHLYGKEAEDLCFLMVLKIDGVFYVRHSEHVIIDHNKYENVILSKIERDEVIIPDNFLHIFKCIWFSNTFNLHFTDDWNRNTFNLSLDKQIADTSYFDFRLNELKNIFEILKSDLRDKLGTIPTEFYISNNIPTVTNRDINSEEDVSYKLLKLFHDRYEKEVIQRGFIAGFKQRQVCYFAENFLWGLLAKFLKDKIEGNSVKYNFIEYEKEENNVFSGRITDWFFKFNDIVDLRKFIEKLKKLTIDNDVMKIDINFHPKNVKITNPFKIIPWEKRNTPLTLGETRVKKNSTLTFQINPKTEKGEKGLQILLDYFLFEDHILNGLNFLGSYLQFDFPQLSTGEYYALRFYALINSKKDKFINIYPDDVYQDPSKYSLLFFIDEADIGLHARWQQKYISELLEKVHEILGTKNIQFILSTHSPIITSDIPKGNVIYMKGHQTTEVNGLTFGANIYDLYRNAFFLDKGAIGEFAKGKIDDCINELYEAINSKENSRKRKEILKNKKQYEDFINLIGDDIVRGKLLQMLYIILEKDPKKALREFYEKKLEDLDND